MRKIPKTIKTALKVTVGIAAAGSLGSTAVAQVAVHHWSFDEGTGTIATDSAGSNDATLLGGATWGVGTGDRASYLSLDGTDDLADPGLALPQWTGANAETWAFWMLDAGGNNNDIVVGNRLDAADAYPNGSNRLFAKFTARGATSGRFVFNDGSGNLLDFNTSTPGYTGGFPADTWIHVAIVRDGADITAYVNGDLVNSTALTVASLPTAGMPFFMGGEPTASATEHFAGGLDDVMIFDQALTQAQVQAIAVPEPSTFVLALGALALGCVTVRRMKKS